MSINLEALDRAFSLPEGFGRTWEETQELMSDDPDAVVVVDDGEFFDALDELFGIVPREDRLAQPVA